MTPAGRATCCDWPHSKRTRDDISLQTDVDKADLGPFVSKSVELTRRRSVFSRKRFEVCHWMSMAKEDVIVSS